MSLNGRATTPRSARAETGPGDELSSPSVAVCGSQPSQPSVLRSVQCAVSTDGEFGPAKIWVHGDALAAVDELPEPPRSSRGPVVRSWDRWRRRWSEMTEDERVDWHRRWSARIMGPLLVVSCFANYIRFRNLNGWLVICLAMSVLLTVWAWRDM